MAGKRLVIEIDLAKYKRVELEADEARKLLEALAERLGRLPDIAESLRYIDNFDEFYEYMRKKFKDYLALPHRPDDYIKGRAVVDKLKLLKEGDSRKVVIVFDRRIDASLLKELLEQMGYEVEVSKVF